MSVRTLGGAPPALSVALTKIELEVPAIDLVVQWHRCGIIADTIADYLALSFEQPEYARSVLATVANELVENAVRFSVEKAAPIRIEARHCGEVVELSAENVSSERHISGLEKLFFDLAQGDLTRVFRERVEAPTRGGLGLLILAKDYAAELGAVLVAKESDDPITVTVRVVLPVKELSES